MPDKPSKVMPALYGGIIMGAVSTIPFLSIINCLCCAGVILGGFMAVFFYKKDLKESDPPLTNADGMQLGALAGVFGAVVGIVLMMLFQLMFGSLASEAFGSVMTSVYDKLGILSKMSPEQIEDMEQQIKDQSLSAKKIIIPFIIDPLFGLVGGLIGYFIYKPKGPAVSSHPPAAV